MMSVLSGGVGAFQGLGGSMNFNTGGAGGLAGLSSNPYTSMSALSGDYATAYNAAQSMNQQLYNNILSGYQSTISQQQAAEQQVQAGYNKLYSNVLNKIQGVQQSESQAIADAYAQQSGAQAQQLVNAGLGNTTVQQSVQRGLTLDEQKAQIANQNQFAQLQAGYMSQLGLAGLSYGNQAIMQNTGEANQMLNWMNTVSAPYPNGAMYGQLAQGYGAMMAANSAKSMLAGMGGGVSGFTPGPTGGYAPNFPTSTTVSPYMGGAGWNMSATPSNASPYMGGGYPGEYGGGFDFDSGGGSNPDLEGFEY